MKSHDIIKAVETRIDLFAFLFLVLWLTVTVLSLIYASANSFQRLGSLWVALLLMLFSFGHLSVMAIANQLKDDPESKASKRFTGLLDFSPEELTIERAFEEKPFYVEGGEVAVKNYLKTDFRLQLARRIEVKSTEYRVIELFLAILSTLQWGYGDLFHCWINGKGWTTC